MKVLLSVSLCCCLLASCAPSYQDFTPTPAPSPPSTPAVSQNFQAYDRVGFAYLDPTLNEEATLTAASTQLPKGLSVIVTNLEKQQSVSVLIVAHRPYRKTHILDISEETAQALGIQGAGKTLVRVKTNPADTENADN